MVNVGVPFPAQLLSDEMLVLSEPAYAPDQRDYASSVTFLPNMSAIASEWHRLVSPAAAGEWSRRAVQASRSFRLAFRPAQIFRRAGVRLP